MITTGRLINKKNAILLIKKTDKLTLGQRYSVIFFEINKEAICDNLILRTFNEEYRSFNIPTKVKGYLNLKYQEDYNIEIKEIREWPR